MALALTLQ